MDYQMGAAIGGFLGPFLAVTIGSYLGRKYLTPVFKRWMGKK